jgi:predicted dehydrogenase
MFDMGIHTIDVLRYILDDEIEEITGFSQNLFIDCNGEDTVSAVFRFKKGVYGSISTSGALPYSRNGVDIHGDKGAIFTDGSLWITARSGEIKLFADDKWETYTTEINNCYVAEIEHFQQCVAEKKTPSVDGEEARKNIEVILAIYKSMDEKRAIKIAG